MKFFYEPIDPYDYALDRSVKMGKTIDSFLAMKGRTEVGDIMVFWVSGVGFVGFAEVVSDLYLQQNPDDRNFDEIVADMKFLGLDFRNPIPVSALSQEEHSRFFSGKQAKRPIDFEPSEIVMKKYREIRKNYDETGEILLIE